MKNIFVENIGDVSVDGTYQDIAARLLDLKWYDIDQCNWENEYPYAPKCSFQIGHTGSHVVLHYHIVEEYVRAMYMKHNDDIWKDSCVEFFVSLDGKQTYYNFEFNMIGSGLIGYGSKEKEERARLNSEIIDTVSTYSCFRKNKGLKEWNTILMIPVTILEVESLKGEKFHANFYKCGDELPKPHFLSWAPIPNETPNFHLPEFFGEIEFE